MHTDPSAAAAAVAAQALAVESCTATPRDGVTAFDGAAATAAGTQSPAKQQQPDPEFDYEQELHNVPASAAAAAAQPASSSNIVGGLLSRQPNWLNETNTNSSNAAPSSSAANPAAHATPAPVALFSNSTSGSTAFQPHGTGRGSSLPPIRGLGAAAAGSSNRGGALPPLAAADLMQQSITAATGGSGAMILSAAAQAVELPAPRRLTGSMGSNKARASLDRRSTGEPAGGGSSSSQHATNSSLLADAPEEQHAGPAAPQFDDAQHGLNAQVARQSLSRSSSGASSNTALPSPQATAAGSSRAIDPADPWSALQSQYVAAAGPASPDSSLSGSTAAVGAAVQRAVLAAGGSKRATRATKEADELVLVDEDEFESSSGGRVGGSAAAPAAAEEWQDEPTTSAAAARAPAGRAVQGEGSFSSASLQRGGGSGGSGGLAAEGSRLRAGQFGGGGLTAESSRARAGQFGGGLAAESSRVKAGGWGAGSMATAGTLMLGDEADETYSEDGECGRPGGAVMPGFAAQDDVFGGDSDSSRAAAGVAMGRLRPERSGRQHLGSSRGHSGTGAVQQQHVAAAAAVLHQQEDEQLGLEEINDVDALIEAELAAKNALPGDLAAKLAAFEAMADDDE
uniref:Uncharacterized protein n=1 Tax=Tetradesmus obliquus TaxID=3088 RepID=A0A383VA33_TETOB|eukprot:jgi/Sobl393_1/9673/SZX62447.1